MSEPLKAASIGSGVYKVKNISTWPGLEKVALLATAALEAAAAGADFEF